MPRKSDEQFISRIESDYLTLMKTNTAEADEHVGKGQYGRSVHHFLNIRRPDLALLYFQKDGGRAKDIREMLIKVGKAEESRLGWNWVYDMYHDEYNLPRRSRSKN
jgi:hypothetical protein